MFKQVKHLLCVIKVLINRKEKYLKFEYKKIFFQNSAQIGSLCALAYAVHSFVSSRPTGEQTAAEFRAILRI